MIDSIFLVIEALYNYHESIYVKKSHIYKTHFFLTRNYFPVKRLENFRRHLHPAPLIFVRLPEHSNPATRSKLNLQQEIKKFYVMRFRAAT